MGRGSKGAPCVETSELRSTNGKSVSRACAPPDAFECHLTTGTLVLLLSTLTNSQRMALMQPLFPPVWNSVVDAGRDIRAVRVSIVLSGTAFQPSKHPYNPWPGPTPHGSHEKRDA